MKRMIRRQGEDREWGGALIPYVAVVVLSLVSAIVVLQLWRADLRVPFMYAGDGLSTSVQIKGMLENGWFLKNPSVGAPEGLDMRDFPTPDNLQMLIMRMIGLITTDYPSAMNLYYLLTFPLTALTAFWVLRYWAVGQLPSMVASLLYAFLPYHIQKGGTMGQLYLASYFMVPLAVWLAVESMGRPLLLPEGPAENAWPRRLGVALICLGIGTAGVYYAYFSVLTLVVAGLYGLVRGRNVRYLASAFVMMGLIVIAGLIAVSPSIVTRFQNGPNPEAVVRAPVEADLWGLKIDQLLLPVEGHRIPVFAKLKNSYLAGLRGWAPWLAVHEAVSLGLVGAVGFLLTLGWVLLFEGGGISLGEHEDALLGRVGSLLVALLVIAITGGIGGLLGYLLPEIRVYARIIVFVAFLSLTTFAIGLDAILRRFASGKRAIALAALYVGIAVFGLWDQVPGSILPDYESTRSRWKSDAAIVAVAEDALPEGALVFQLPYMRFPESPPPYPGKMNDYDLFRGYMHSTTLRWSYGAMKGRENDLWQRELSSKPIDEIVPAIQASGFDAVWVDLGGYPDADSTVREMTNVIGRPPSISADGRIALFIL